MIRVSDLRHFTLDSHWLGQFIIRSVENKWTTSGKLLADAVFEGGGVKGIGLVGAVSYAEELGYKWVNVAGTSAGAIVASLIAAGYSGVEMKGILSELDYSRFRDTSVIDRLPVLGPLTNLIFEKGIYEGEFLYGWLEGLLKKKGVATFGDLVIPEYEGDLRYRFKLRVIASDISRGRLIILPQDIASYGLAPEKLGVALAVRMSMSIPFFYEPVRLMDSEKKGVSYVVDGGILSNFPVWLFDSEGIPDWPTFGFKLVEPTEGVPREIRGPVSLLTALFATMSEAHDARYIEAEHFVRTIAIPSLGMAATDFELSKERREALFESGRRAAEGFFASWDFDSYVERYRSGKEIPGRGLALRGEP